MFEPWPDSQHHFLGQDSLLSQCLSPFSSMNEHLANKMLEANLQWISVPPRGNINDSTSFMETDVHQCCGPMA